MQMLNIDALLGETKTLMWRDKKHVILEPTVEQALRMQRTVDTLTDKETEPELIVQEMLDMIKVMVPDLDTTTLPLRVVPAVFIYIAAVKIEDENDVVASLENAITSQPQNEKKTRVKK